MDHSCRVQSFAFQESAKANIPIHFNSYLLFCDYFNFVQFPVSKQSFFIVLGFSSKSLLCYCFLLSYVNILKHINQFLDANISFMHNYDVFSPSVGYVMSWVTRCVAFTLLLLISFE